MAGIYDAMVEAQTVLETIDPAPDVVAIVPKGHETKSPASAKSFWHTLHPESDSETPEPGDSYLAHYKIGVTVWVKSNEIDETIVSALSTKINDTRGALRYNDLDGFGRVELLGDEFEGGEYIDGEDAESVYGYQFFITVTHQY